MDVLFNIFCFILGTIIQIGCFLWPTILVYIGYRVLRSLIFSCIDYAKR